MIFLIMERIQAEREKKNFTIMYLYGMANIILEMTKQ